MPLSNEENGGTTRSICEIAVIRYTDKDILSGRGGLANKHPGNILFRRLVEIRKDLYKRLSNHHKKAALVQSIIDSIKHQGGRFLKIVPNSQLWEELTDKEAFLKTSQALREPNRKAAISSFGDSDCETAFWSCFPSSSENSGKRSNFFKDQDFSKNISSLYEVRPSHLGSARALARHDYERDALVSFPTTTTTPSGAIVAMGTPIDVTLERSAISQDDIGTPYLKPEAFAIENERKVGSHSSFFCVNARDDHAAFAAECC